MRVGGQLNIRLSKKIPMGGGLGGGSSDAAAILLALPALAGKTLSTETLLELAAGLGSDVPFFLFGGSAVAQGRGTELYGLPDIRKQYGIVVAPGVHVSTPEAYKALGRGLTSDASSNIINSFQAFVWDLGGWQTESGKPPVFENDFESVVFENYPRLKSIKRKLLKLGASSAMMSGSGSALFGLFATREGMEAARGQWERMRIDGESAFPIQTVSRTQYQAQWLRSLAPYVNRKVWPPQSRCA
jgi:4-diphosphocytidyl-2-C-methyl-D-erythritol kinase